MNVNLNDFNYIDGLNTYPIQDYIDANVSSSITSNIAYNISCNIYTSNIRISSNKFLNNNIYYYNSNLIINNDMSFGDIIFKTSYNYPNDSNLTAVKIDYTGKLKVYHNYNILQPTFTEGYYDVEDELLALKADGISTDLQLTGIEAGIVYIQGEIDDTIIALNLVEGQVNTLIGNLYFADSFESYKQLAEGANFGNIQSIYGSTIMKIRERASSLYTNSLTNGLIISAGVGIAGAVLSAGAAYLYYEKASNSLMSNVNITPAEKSNIYNSNVISEITTYTEFYNSTSNLSINQGFINCNIKSQQYISELKCDNLYLNNGNVSGINYINVNNVVADGRIKENNKFLDTTYLTSNHLYNLSNNYSAERQYPSKLYTSTSSEDTAILLGKLVYRNILYLDNSGVSYGSGFYEVYSSSTYDTPTTKNKLFNYNTTETTNTPRWQIALYNSGTGNYQGDNGINGGYYGDWVIIKMPQSILLTRYRIYQNTFFNQRAPAEWKVYGSNDGITFTEITEASQMIRIVNADYTTNFFNKTLATTFTTQYQYFGFVFNKLLSTSGETTLDFAELQIFGKEIISNSIVSNIYTTSNVVKSIVEFEMPIVCKHKAFYCRTETLIYPNSGNVAYYKYDIDMRNYTTTGYIQIGSQSNDPYRIFRIRAFLGSCYFSAIINGLPNILHYEIYMSHKANAASGGQGAAGVNIYSIGIPNNPNLNIIPPNNIFILSNPFNDFNYITLVSTVPADIRVIIEDLIS